MEHTKKINLHKARQVMITFEIRIMKIPFKFKFIACMVGIIWCFQNEITEKKNQIKKLKL